MALSYDEVFASSGEPRPHTEALAGALSELGREELADAGRRRDAIFMQQGITFDAGGPDVDGPVRDRPFPLDLVPRVIPAAARADRAPVLPRDRLSAAYSSAGSSS